MASPDASNTRLALALCACLALALAAVALIRGGVRAPTPEEVEGRTSGSGDPADPAASKKPNEGGAGAQAQGAQGPEERKIVACYLTRRAARPYQTLVRYQWRRLPLQEMPGWTEVAESLERQGKRVPDTVVQMEQATETWADNLGEVVRALASYRAYLHPVDGRILSFDIAMTNGSLPQRLVGWLIKSGVRVTVFQGGRRPEEKEIDFPANSLIMPLDMDFLHRFYRQQKNLKESTSFRFFVPEFMDFVTLVATPKGTEVLPHMGANKECARYEVLASSSKTSEGAVVRQHLWFDLKEGLLLRRVDFEEGVSAEERTVTERADPAALGTLQPLVLRPPPPMPRKPLPFPLDQELLYRVRAGEQDLGTVRVRFSRQAAGPGGPAGYRAAAQVETGNGNVRREEQAETRYDEDFRPLSYTATGVDSGDARADYVLKAALGGGRLRMSVNRRLQAASGAAAQALTPGQNEPHAEPPAPRLAGWKEPLPRADLSDPLEGSLRPERLRPQRMELDRALSPGTFLFDYNRVEHLAALACQFPLPPAPQASGPQDGGLRFQSVAFFSVYQRQAGVVRFAIRTEPRAAPQEAGPDLAEELEEEGPPLILAASKDALLPCTLLLAPDGRLLQFTHKYGSSDVTFTLDDPVMRRRASNERKRRGQEGPTLLRPPWY